VGPATEAFTRHMLRDHPDIALLLVESSLTLASTPSADAYRAVANHYGVPLVRYSLAVRDSRLAWSPKCLREAFGFRNCGPHPPVRTHQLLSSVLLASFLRVLQELPPHSSHAPSAPAELASGVGVDSRVWLPTPLSNQLQQFGVCIPRTFFGSGGRTIGVKVPLGNWSYFEERRGKPGWNTDGPAGAVIEFPLEFGPTPMALLSFMRGYDANLGEIQVRMVRVTSPAGHSMKPERVDSIATKHWEQNFFQVDGLRSDGARVTQAATVRIQAGRTLMQNYAYTNQDTNGRAGVAGQWPKAYSGVLGFGLPPNSNATLQITLLCPRSSTCRFKIINVASC
jgi:hypothetical protein